MTIEKEIFYYPDTNIVESICFFDEKGLFHNPKGSASTIYYKTGEIQTEYYFIEGIEHREDGPAYISYHENGQIESEEYWIDGKQHSEDGPAFITYDIKGNKASKPRYYLNDKEIDVFKWHNQKNVDIDNMTDEEKIQRKLEIGF